MKIKFNPNLRFQREAIDSVVDIFRGQETMGEKIGTAPIIIGRCMWISQMSRISRVVVIGFPHHPT
jgi:acetyltransferase-like isoleucine patch superfamily enzyme